jgi:plasmid stabilization system protein ParE
VESITRTFPHFAKMPEAGTPRDEIEPGVRGFPAGKYMVYYHSRTGHVLISRVIHGMRDQENAFLDQDFA